MAVNVMNWTLRSGRALSAWREPSKVLPSSAGGLTQSKSLKHRMNHGAL